MTINPPGLASKSYELYKQELLAWREVTEVCRSKQGIVLALTLPNEEPFKVRENVLNDLSLDELKRENGLDTLIEYLDVYLKKDDLSDRFEKYEDFENVQRTNEQNIREFIADFDSKYRKLWKMSINLPPEILAFKLLKTVNITKHQKMLVLTGVNFSNKETIYEDMKQSLRKFIGNSTENSVHIGSNVKLEPEFLAKHERELFKAGYVKQPYGGNMRKLHGGSCTEIGGQNCGLMHMGKKRNPVGMNGKLLKCKSCGSYRHLVAECPDSWKNMEKKNVSKKDFYSMFPCVKGGICSNEGLTRSENKELQVGLEMNHSIPGELSVEIARLNNEVKCLKEEIRMMKGDKDEQIIERKQRKKWENSIQEEVIAQIKRLKDELTKAKTEIKKMQDDRQIGRFDVDEQKLEKEIEKQLHDTRRRFDSTVDKLQNKISRLEEERCCTVENKEADMVVTKHKVKELNGTGQMIQEIAQSIKQEKHKQSFVPQVEQKCGLTLEHKGELEQMIIREILSICDIKLLRMMYCDNQLKYAMNIQEVYQRFKMLQKDKMQFVDKSVK